MDQLIPQLREHFDHCLDRFASFHRHGVQVEGWLKGELLLALDRIKEGGVIPFFDREVKLGGKKIDLVVDDDKARYFVELKHWTSDQKGVHYSATWYFRDRANGIVGDVEKLTDVVQAPAERRLLILVTAAPTAEDWRNGVTTFNSLFAPHELVSLTNPADVPEPYFLGLLRVL